MAIVTVSPFLSDPSDDGLRIEQNSLPHSLSLLLLPARPLRRIECAIARPEQNIRE